jgi:hypothetical protein
MFAPFATEDIAFPPDSDLSANGFIPKAYETSDVRSWMQRSWSDGPIQEPGFYRIGSDFALTDWQIASGAAFTHISSAGAVALAILRIPKGFRLTADAALETVRRMARGVDDAEWDYYLFPFIPERVSQLRGPAL